MYSLVCVFTPMGYCDVCAIFACVRLQLIHIQILYDAI
jgi:hypothetical protein